MKKHLKTAAMGAALALSGLAANAATVHNVSGVVCEGGVQPAIGCAGATVLGDFGSNPANVVLEVAGDVSLYGGIAHASDTRYFDSWTMDFGTGVYDAVFNFQTKGQTPLFDGVLTVAGSALSFSTTGSGSLSLGSLTGVVTFVLDPIQGAGVAREEGTWDLQIAAVPLPGAAFLLLGALGGLAAAGRRKKA